MNDYLILHERTALDLERAVRETLHDGYEPVGGVAVTMVEDKYVFFYQSMYRKAKAKRKKAEPFDPAPPDGVNPEVWDRWLRIRKEKKNPVTKSIYEGVLASLTKWKAQGYDINAIVQTSTERGWVGLFPPKDKAPADQLAFLPDNDDELVAWASRVGGPLPTPGQGFPEYRQTLRNWYARQ